MEIQHEAKISPQKLLDLFGDKTLQDYDLRPVKSLRVAGKALRVLSIAIRIPVLSNVIGKVILWQVGFFRFRRYSADGEARMHPEYPFIRQLNRDQARKSVQSFVSQSLLATAVGTVKRERGIKKKGIALEKSRVDLSSETVFDFHQAYLEKTTTPSLVAKRILDVIRSMEDSAVPLKPLLMWDAKDLIKQAERSSERFAKGKPLGVLDGVPVAVKDELDLLPFKTMGGTRFYGTRHPDQDATSVAKLRAGGALMIGKSNMHELGIGITGMNPSCGTARNPHHPDYYPGGSSSGTAVAVASGLCPLGLGLDGGGSIRIPAALCGIVGLKTTWGRISRAGSIPLSWSVSTAGPMGLTVRDVALGYAMIAGPDERDGWTRNQPPVHLGGLEYTDLEGLRLGWFPPWLNHSRAEVAHAVQSMFEPMRAAGASLKEIRIPGLDAAHLSLLVTIISEIRESMKTLALQWRSPLCLENFINLRLAGMISGDDYVRAQRVRSDTMARFTQIFRDVDAVITPTTACTAPLIQQDSLVYGESDLSIQNELMRFVTVANLTGLPALTLPVGYDGRGLPIGLQLIGRPWEEACLLRIALALEKSVTRKAPMLHYTLLDEIGTDPS